MIEYIIIAILQGLFEWLPISSSGQVMIVAMKVFGFSPSEALSLAIWLHLGTTCAVIVKFRKDFIQILKSFLPRKFEKRKTDKNTRNWLIIATIGTALTAVPLYFLLKAFLEETYSPLQGDIITLVISGLLILTGIILLKKRKEFGIKKIDSISEDVLYKNAFITGLIQGVSILPGISRSGITVSALLIEDYEQDNALKLSFLMSVPVALAAIGLDFISGDPMGVGITVILIATGVSFLVGYLSMEVLMKLAKKIEFGYFCVIYGIIAFCIIIPFLLISGT